MSIQMVDLVSQYHKIKNEVDAAILGVIEKGTFIGGAEVDSFSKELALYNNVNHVITCANGTDALQVAMMALDFKSGDEIILPVHTYVATAEVIALLGLVPVFVDVDPVYFTIDVSLIEAKITSKTVAIVPVHLYGQCADMEAILTIAKKYSLHVIEDAAQAIGSQFTFSNGEVKFAGTMGTIGTTSFFPSKNLGCFGDGGALFTNDSELADKIKMICNHGQKVKYQHDIIGINSRLDNLQAAILRIKLRELDNYSTARNTVANFYDTKLAISGLQIPVRFSSSTHVFHQYTVLVKDGKRNELKNYLQENGIPTMIYYPIPLHKQKAYSSDEYFPVSENLSKEVLSLPIHTEMNKDELNYIVEKIAQFYTI